MTPQLVALSEGPNLPIDKPILLVGRHQECDVQIPSRKISRKHCCIAQVADYLVVRDLFSTNGVRINGERVPEGVLHHGDELTIGNLKYRLEWQPNGQAKDEIPEINLQPPPAPSPVQDLSSDAPVALRDDSKLPPAPVGLPLIVPIPSNKDRP
jgi:predicted component of type VI protein secretion system